MKILKIKQPGLTIDIPGLSSKRTPTEIDITKLNIDIIFAELRRCGIEDFEIKIQPDKKNNENMISQKHNKKIDSSNNNNFNSLYLNHKLDNIENLLRELLIETKTKNDNVVYSSSNLKKENKTLALEQINNKDNSIEEEDFIPTINLSGFKIRKGKTND